VNQIEAKQVRSLRTVPLSQLCTLG
jgi:hypothetical protein